MNKDAKKPLTIEINGEPEDVAKFIEMMMPRRPTDADKLLAAKLWGGRKKAKARPL